MNEEPDSGCALRRLRVVAATLEYRIPTSICENHVRLVVVSCSWALAALALPAGSMFGVPHFHWLISRICVREVPAESLGASIEFTVILKRAHREDLGWGVVVLWARSGWAPSASAAGRGQAAGSHAHADSDRALLASSPTAAGARMVPDRGRFEVQLLAPPAR